MIGTITICPIRQMRFLKGKWPKSDSMFAGEAEFRPQTLHSAVLSPSSASPLWQHAFLLLHLNQVSAEAGNRLPSKNSRRRGSFSLTQPLSLG